MELKEQILNALGLSNDKEVNLGFQAKLVDGTIIVSEADALAGGVDISVLTEDGTTIPLPVGEFELEDGTIIVVTEEGVVAEVKEAEVEEEEEAEEEEMQKEDFDKVAFIDEVKAVVQDLVAEATSDIEKLKSEIEELKESNGTLETEKAELESQVVELSKQPAAKPVNPSKFKSETPKEVKDVSKMTRQEKFWYNLNNNKK